MSLAANNRRRGAAAEVRVAAALGGEVYGGTAGDVDALGYRVEVKSSEGLRGYGKLRDHITQAKANSKAAQKPWMLVITGGQSFNRSANYVLMELDAALDLIRQRGEDGSVSLPAEKFAALLRAYDNLSEAVQPKSPAQAARETQ